MLRDQVEETMDMAMVEEMDLSVLNLETIHSYRNRHRVFRMGHPWENLDDENYLLKIGAVKKGKDLSISSNCCWTIDVWGRICHCGLLSRILFRLSRNVGSYDSLDRSFTIDLR